MIFGVTFVWKNGFFEGQINLFLLAKKAKTANKALASAPEF